MMRPAIAIPARHGDGGRPGVHDDRERLRRGADLDRRPIHPVRFFTRERDFAERVHVHGFPARTAATNQREADGRAAGGVEHEQQNQEDYEGQHCEIAICDGTQLGFIAGVRKYRDIEL